MRPVNPAAQSLREERGGFGTRQLIWIEARNRISGAVEALGLWSGEDDATFSLTDAWTRATVTRTFAGFGTLLEVKLPRLEVGLSVRPAIVSLGAFAPAVLQAVRQYDVRGARVQIWEATLSPESGLIIGFETTFKGFANRAPIKRPVPGGQAGLELTLVSTARLLAVSSPRRKSDVEQQRRNGDRIRRYKALAKSLDIAWGMKDVRK